MNEFKFVLIEYDRILSNVPFSIVVVVVIHSEILRVIDSLQLVDRLPYVATPANWVVSE